MKKEILVVVVIVVVVILARIVQNQTRNKTFAFWIRRFYRFFRIDLVHNSIHVDDSVAEMLVNRNIVEIEITIYANKLAHVDKTTFRYLIRQFRERHERVSFQFWFILTQLYRSYVAKWIGSNWIWIVKQRTEFEVNSSRLSFKTFEWKSNDSLNDLKDDFKIFNLNLD